MNARLNLLCAGALAALLGASSAATAAVVVAKLSAPVEQTPAVNSPPTSARNSSTVKDTDKDKDKDDDRDKECKKPKPGKPSRC